MIVGSPESNNFGHRHRQSNLYAKRLSQLFVHAGYRVVHRAHGTPDADFIYMAAAKWMVQGGGGHVPCPRARPFV